MKLLGKDVIILFLAALADVVLIINVVHHW
jgi:hypothetical protein